MSSLSSLPDHILISDSCRNKYDYNNWIEYHMDQFFIDMDCELDSRRPDIAAYYFGDCDGQPIFIPVEPEYDSEGQPIVSEMVGYNDKGEEAGYQHNPLW